MPKEKYLNVFLNNSKPFNISYFKSYWLKYKNKSNLLSENQTVGSNKEIVWDVLKDRDKFEGDQIFGIEAVNINEKEKEEKRKENVT